VLYNGQLVSAKGFRSSFGTTAVGSMRRNYLVFSDLHLKCLGKRFFKRDSTAI